MNTKTHAHTRAYTEHYYAQNKAKQCSEETRRHRSHTKSSVAKALKLLKISSLKMLPLCMTPTNSAQNRAVVFSVNNKSLSARTTNSTRLTFTTKTTLRRGSSNTSRSSVAGRFSRRSSSLNSSSALGRKMVNFAVNEADGEAEDDRDEEAFETDEERRFSAAFSSSSSSFKNDDGGFQRQRRTGRRRRKLKNSLDFEDDIEEEEDVGTGRGRREETEERDDYDERRRGRGDGRRGQRERERRRRRRSSSSSSSSSSSYSSPALPNVTLLTNGETEKCLPIAATSNQYGYFWGTTDAAVQRVAISLLGVVLCSTINDFEIGTALQVPFATFFLWAPIALAARRNAAARAGEFVGLWRARVKDIEVVPVVAKTFENARKKSSSRGRRNTRKTTSEMLLIDFIDPISSFEVSFRIPNERRYDDVQIGDACELIVSSDDDLFRNFVAIREAYVPELDVWVGEYPFLDRNGFVLVSKRVSNN